MAPTERKDSPRPSTKIIFQALDDDNPFYILTDKAPFQVLEIKNRKELPLALTFFFVALLSLLFFSVGGQKVTPLSFSLSIICATIITVLGYMSLNKKYEGDLTFNDIQTIFPYKDVNSFSLPVKIHPNVVTAYNTLGFRNLAEAYIDNMMHIDADPLLNDVEKYTIHLQSLSSFQSSYRKAMDFRHEVREESLKDYRDNYLNTLRPYTF